MVDVTTEDVLELLRKAVEKYGEEYVDNGYDGGIYVYTYPDGRHCLIGAMAEVSPDVETPIYEQKESLEPFEVLDFGRCGSGIDNMLLDIQQFNDEGRKWGEILKYMLDNERSYKCGGRYGISI